MNDDEVTRRLLGGPPVPQVREDAVSLIMAGAEARRRRRGRAAVIASVAAVGLTIALIAGGSALFAGGEHPVPVPVAPSTTAGLTPTTAPSDSSPSTDHLKTAPAKSSTGSSPAVGPVASVVRTLKAPGGAAVPTTVSGTAFPVTTPGAVVPSSRPSSPPGSSASSVSAGSSVPAVPSGSVTGTGILHLDSFRLPSGNIGCRMTNNANGPEVRCAIVHSTAGVCGPGWNHELILDAVRATSCVTGTVVALPDGPILKYGQANVVGGIVCVSDAQAGLHCSSALYGTGFTVNSATMTTQQGEGGLQGADLAAATGNPPVVMIKSGTPSVFGSVDLGVVCNAQTAPAVRVYCARTQAPAVGSCTDLDKTVQLTVVTQGTAVTSFCGTPALPGSGSGGPLAAMKGKIVPGTEFVVGPATCTAHQDWVSCSGGGDGFSMSAVTGYGPLPAG